MSGWLVARLWGVSGSAQAVSLRPLGPSDADTLAQWGDDPEFSRVADWSGDMTHADRATFFSRLIAAPPPDLIRLAALAEGVMVGYVDLRGTDPEERELGFLIGSRARWGGGLGRSAAEAGCSYGFDVLNLRLIWAQTTESNLRSVAILRHLGMTEVPATDEDGRRFSLTEDTWRK